MDFYKEEESKIFQLNVAGEYVELPEVNGESDAVTFYQNSYDSLKTEIQVLFDKIDSSSNKGSHLVKLKSYKESIQSHQGIGDYKDLDTQINRHIEEIEVLVEQNRHKNLQQKKVLLEAIKEIVEESNWKAFEQVKEIHQSWMRIGKATEEFDSDLNESFDNYRTTFFDQRKEYADTQKELYESRANIYRDIIVQLEQILENKDLASFRLKVIELQEKWKNNGAVPKVTYDSLFNLYKGYTDKFFEQLKTQRKNDKKDNKAHTKEILAAKSSVLKSLKEYLKKPTTDFTIKDAQKFRQEWNSAGKVSFKLINDIADEFYLNLEYLFEFINLNKYLAKGKKPLTAENQLKAIQKFFKDNERELSTFKENKENMMLFGATDKVSDMVERRQKELERKLRAKKKVIGLLKEER